MMNELFTKDLVGKLSGLASHKYGSTVCRVFNTYRSFLKQDLPISDDAKLLGTLIVNELPAIHIGGYSVIQALDLEKDSSGIEDGELLYIVHPEFSVTVSANRYRVEHISVVEFTRVEFYKHRNRVLMNIEPLEVNDLTIYRLPEVG